MRIAATFGIVVVCALLGQGASAFADPAAQDGKQDAQTAKDSCPTGTVKGTDGVCTKPKAGQMGFDLAAPSDDDKSSSNRSSSDGTRSTGNSGHN